MKSLLLASAFGFTAAVNAQSVTFSDFLDDGLSTGFDISLNDTSIENQLNIGISSFSAGGASNFMNDTLTFLVTAPVGFHIVGVAYSEGGSGNVGIGVATATGSMVADGIPTNFLTQIFTPNTSGAWTIATDPVGIANKTQIAVSISNNLFGIALDPESFAAISKDAAVFNVAIAPIPLPPAVWLFGSALVGLATLRRRVGGGNAA